MADDPLAELRGLHTPPMDLSATVAEALAALAVGLLLAWAIAEVIRAVTARRVSPEARALRRLDAVGGQAGAEGLAQRAAILQDYAAGLEGEDDWLARLDAQFGGLFSSGSGKGLREALYRPGASFDLGRFDADLRAALGRAIDKGALFGPAPSGDPSRRASGAPQDEVATREDLILRRPEGPSRSMDAGINAAYDSPRAER